MCMCICINIYIYVNMYIYIYIYIYIHVNYKLIYVYVHKFSSLLVITSIGKTLLYVCVREQFFLGVKPILTLCVWYVYICYIYICHIYKYADMLILCVCYVNICVVYTPIYTYIRRCCVIYIFMPISIFMTICRLVLIQLIGIYIYISLYI